MDTLRINLIGKPGSGKSTLADYLSSEYGFDVFRPSDVIRNYAKARQIMLAHRGDYVNAHHLMLQENPNAMTDPIINHASSRLCIDGLRVPSHAARVQQAVGLITIGLECPDEVRFSRVLSAQEIRAHRDASKIIDFDEFLADEAPDNQTEDPSKPSVPLVMAMAKFVICNVGDISGVQASLSNYLRNRLG